MKIPKIDRDILIISLSFVIAVCLILIAFNFKTLQTKMAHGRLNNAINLTATGTQQYRKLRDAECRTSYQGWTDSKYVCSIEDAAIYTVSASEVLKIDDNLKKLENKKYLSDKYDAWLTSVEKGVPTTKKSPEYTADLLSGKIALAEFKYLTKDDTTLNIALVSNKYRLNDDHGFSPANVGRASTYVSSLADEEYLYVVRAWTSFTMPEFLDFN